MSFWNQLSKSLAKSTAIQKQITSMQNRVVDQSWIFGLRISEMFSKRMNTLIDMAEGMNGKSIGGIEIRISIPEMKECINYNPKEIREKLRTIINYKKYSSARVVSARFVAGAFGVMNDRDFFDQEVQKLKTSLTKDAKESIKYVKGCLNASMESLEILYLRSRLIRSIRQKIEQDKIKEHYQNALYQIIAMKSEG